MHPDSQARFTISKAAQKLSVHPRTLRNYEKAGLVKPSRKGKWRLYSQQDIAWIECLFSIIHEQKINITSVGKLLEYAPCWEIANCSDYKRQHCAWYHAQQEEHWDHATG